VFDPLLLAERDVSVTVAAESTLVVADRRRLRFDRDGVGAGPLDTLQAFRLDSGPGSRVERRIDAQGHVCGAWTPGGFTVERTAFESRTKISATATRCGWRRAAATPDG